MRIWTQFAMSVITALALCSAVNAQHAARVSTPARVTAPDSIRTTPARLVNNGRSNIAFTPAPGFGFDYAHLAAITRGLSRENLRWINPPQRLDFAGGLTPLLPIIFPAPVIIFQQSILVVPAPEVDEEDGATPIQRELRAQSAARAEPPPRDYVPVPLPPPMQDTGEFVLVKRDGMLVFAVAFSSCVGQLVYVTREGVRRSLALADLDSGVTRRINEERGTIIQLPL